MLSHRYRTRRGDAHIEVDAARVRDILRAAQHHWSELPDWIRDAYTAGTLVFLRDAIRISTPSGPVLADRADWIVNEPGPNGRRHLRPFRPDDFAAAHQPASVPAASAAPSGYQAGPVAARVPDRD